MWEISSAHPSLIKASGKANKLNLNIVANLSDKQAMQLFTKHFSVF